MKNFGKYYLIITQILAFLLVPPLVAYALCKRFKANNIQLGLAVAFTAIIGVILALVFALRVFKKMDKVKKENNSNKELETKENENKTEEEKDLNTSLKNEEITEKEGDQSEQNKH